jgi:hypothetical protein
MPSAGADGYCTASLAGDSTGGGYTGKREQAEKMYFSRIDIRVVESRLKQGGCSTDEQGARDREPP